MRIHAIMPALNEEVFIEKQLRTLYPFCSGISVLTQYDRDWYGKKVTPDRTVELVSNFPDPEGKIHLVLRRWRDQAAALNSEMGALSSHPAKRVQSHGTPQREVDQFHSVPDYFWIVDADEVYDPATIPRMLALLERRRPRGMRVHGYNYLRTWNRRVSMEAVQFCQFGFVRPGVTFTSIRQVTWNESRLQKLLRVLHLPDFSARAFGFMDCPKDVAVFHHGCWLGDNDRLRAKASKSAHTWIDRDDYAGSLETIPFDFIPTSDLPDSIRSARWPEKYLQTTADAQPDHSKQHRI
jgi:hypothetical protein